MTYNFYQLIEQFTISIPMIQRDYAQGRKSAEVIRDKFLVSLKSVLLPEVKDSAPRHMHLDFVYGSTLSGQFIPLDGQQRLTTLFLLHWYIAAKEGHFVSIESNEQAEDLRKLLSKFSYDTRISSERFCEALALNPILVSAEESLSEAIMDSPWFVASWNSDPTVHSMLTMLDAINKHFFDCGPVWDLLTAAETITFEFIDIKSDQFKLTDELYIKMNSRGKGLSDFETFKAQFTELLVTQDFEGHTMSCNQSEISYRQYFEIKMDGSWMNLFWDCRNVVGIDDGIINFLNFVAEMLYYIDHGSESKFHFKDALQTVFTKRKNARFLFDVLDILASCNSVNEYFKQFFHCEGEASMGRLKLFEIEDANLFLRVIRDNRLEVRYRILFYALFYHKLNLPEATTSELIDFLRIIRNLTLRIRQVNGAKRIEYVSNLRLPDFASYHLFVHALVDSIKVDPTVTVYEVFSRGEWVGFGETYLAPEKNKATHILLSSASKLAIHKLEDHDLIQGIPDLFATESDQIAELTDGFFELWNGQFSASQLIRGLLTHGDYSIATHDWSSLGKIWYYGVDGFWNRLLTAITERKSDQQQMKMIFSGFLLDFVGRGGTSKERLCQIIDNYDTEVRDYRYYFVKYSAMTTNFHGKMLNLFTWYEGNDFSINNVGSSSVQPLSAYHLNPYVVALTSSINNPNKTKLFYGRFTDELSCVEINKKVQLSAIKEGWHIIVLKGYKLSDDLIKKYKLIPQGSGYLIMENAEKDRIEIATQFANEVIQG